mgnify:CR=1 FL=1
MSSPEKSTPLIARTAQMETLRSARARLAKKQGSLLFVAAESGYGKSALLKEFSIESSSKNGAVTVTVECQSPVGNFQVGNLQPLHPFLKILEELAANDSKSAQKKLVFNIGMSVLTILPFVGDAIYAVKEIGKDVRDFKKEKATTTKVKSVVSEVFDLLKEYSLKSPLVLLMDDMQWCDAESVELLEQFAEHIANLPIMIAVCYRPNLVSEQLVPLMSLVKQWQPNGKNIIKLDIPPFTVSEIGLVCEAILPKYRRHIDFEQWLWDKSSGLPQIVIEFLQYFERVSPFDSNGNLSSEFMSGELVPTSVHAAFGRLVAQLSDDERNMLSLCSAEGNECTAFILSRLMNTDIVTVIKKLRTLQQRTGIIHSIGAHPRYGVKTTVYQFGQLFYQQHFHSLLEYEEKNALHDQIASILGKHYDEADNHTKKIIAPYLAAHHFESGNEAAARSMLAVTAQAASDVGSSSITEEAHKRFDELSAKNEKPEHTLELISTFNKIDGISSGEVTNGGSVDVESEVKIEEIEKEVIALYHEGMFEKAAELAESSIETIRQTSVGVARLWVLAAKARIEMDDISTAKEYCKKCLAILETTPDAETKCMVLNTLAIVSIVSRDTAVGWNYLHQAAEVASSLSNEYRLLTITNIALLLQKTRPQEAVRYKKAAKALCKSLHFSRFALEAFE